MSLKHILDYKIQNVIDEKVTIVVDIEENCYCYYIKEENN